MALNHQLSNGILHLNPQVKIVIYTWDTQDIADGTPNSVLNKSSRLEVSSQVTECSFSKMLGGPSGSFRFTLSNSPGFGTKDWKDLIQKGSWCVIYMSQKGDLTLSPRVDLPTSDARPEASNIRCIGFIDRVAVKSELNEQGAFDIVYEVTGRDFGVVYEDSNVWNNLFQMDKLLLDSLKLSGLNVLGAITLDKALSTMHDLLLYPANLDKAKLNDDNSLTSVGLQWLLPAELVSDLNIPATTETFWGALPDVTRNFSSTSATLAIASPSDYLFGNVWANLKKLAVPELHELFTETTDEGLPRLTFRPIPFALNTENYPTQGRHVTLYKDLEPIIEVPALEVYAFDLGEDNHTRYNSFLVTLSTSLISVADNISSLTNSGFPKHIKSDIRRYGFRPMHITAHSLVKGQNDGKSDRVLHVEFNHLLQDYWESAVYSESGTINIIGNPEIKIGKVLKFGDSTPYVSEKRFYIEGYIDTFTVGAQGETSWDTTVFVTRGFEEADLLSLSKSDFVRRDSDFTHSGDFIPAGGA